MQRQHFSPTASLALLMSSLATAPALSQNMPGSEHLTITAKTDFTSMHAGEKGYLAVDIIVDEDWHTYWPGVSDTGYGVKFDIETPESITLGDPIWPSPHRYLQRGGILDHTYEGTQTVLFPFEIGDDISDSVVVFNIETDYLVCDEVCLPGDAQTTASLSIVDSHSETVKSEYHENIRKLVDARPVPFNKDDQAVRLQWIKSAAAVMFRDAKHIEFYPDKECTPLAEPIADGVADGNRLEIRFAESDHKVLSGRLRVKTPEGEFHYDIHEVAP